MVKQVLHLLLAEFCVVFCFIFVFELYVFTVIEVDCVRSGWAAIGLIGASWLVGRMMDYACGYRE